MPSTRQGIIDHLKTYSTLTDLLGAGSSSVIVPGRWKSNLPSPCLVVRKAFTAGSARRLPHYQELWEVRCYWNPVSRAGGRWPEIDEIMGHVRGRLHDASLTVDDGTLWKISWDGFESGDNLDYITETWFRIIRFRAYRSTSYW